MEEKPKRKYRRTAPTKESPYGYTKQGVPKVRASKKMIASGIRVIKTNRPAQRREKQGYLKYFQIVMEWAMIEHEINMDDLQCLLFLYDENAFTSKDIPKYSILVRIGKDRIKKLHDKGLITINYSKDGNSRVNVYEVSHKGKTFCSSIYKKMNMQEELSTIKLINRVSKKTNSVKNSYILSVNKFNSLFKERRDAAVLAAKKKREENANKKKGRGGAWDGSYGK